MSGAFKVRSQADVELCKQVNGCSESGSLMLLLVCEGLRVQDCLKHQLYYSEKTCLSQALRKVQD